MESRVEWAEAERRLRERCRDHGELHLLQPMTEHPPHRFRFALSPDNYGEAIVYGGRVYTGGEGLEALAEYLRAIDLRAHPEWYDALLGLVVRFAELPTIAFKTSSSYEREGEHAPRIEPPARDPDGALRLVLTYLDERPLEPLLDIAARDPSEHEPSPSGPLVRVSGEVPLTRAILELKPDGSLRWRSESSTTRVSKSRLVPRRSTRARDRWRLRVTIAAAVAILALALARALMATST